MKIQGQGNYNRRQAFNFHFSLHKPKQPAQTRHDRFVTGRVNSAGSSKRRSFVGKKTEDSMEGPQASVLHAGEGEVIHEGGCHCGAVRYKCVASPFIKAVDCK